MTGPVVTLLTAALLQAQPSPDLGPRVRELAEPLVERADFAGVIAIEGPEAHARVAVGFADLAAGEPNRPDTRFGIGSVSKQLTAALILRLVERGELSLGDTLQRIMPEFEGLPITVHQLLAHRSGLARDPFDLEQQSQRRTSQEIIEHIAALPREFDPGERTSYSNSGFVILSLIAERVTGTPYCEALRNEVLEPLGLDDTGCLDTGRRIPRLARGYDPGPGPTRLMRSPPYEWSNVAGAGQLYSTANDMVRWGRTILTRSFLAAESWDAMLADHGDGRGYGIATYTRHGHTVIGHDGVINGYTAFVEILPDDGTVVAYAGNIRSGAFELVERMATALAVGAAVDPIVPPDDVDAPIDAAAANHLTGAYELFPGFYLDISYADERLLLSGTGGYPTVLSSLPGGDYFYRAMYATIHFDSAPDDERLVWIDRGGQEYPARKVSP